MFSVSSRALVLFTGLRTGRLAPKHQRAAPFGTARFVIRGAQGPHRRKKPLTLSHQGLACNGGSCGVRTCDSLLKRQILYLLS